jgi:hypothetical protein
LSAGRLDAQINMAEQHQQRLERRVTEMQQFIQSLDEEQQAQGRRVNLVSDFMQSTQANRGQAELEWQRRLADLEQDQRALAGATHAAAARDEEAQRRYMNRLRPIEERLCALETEQRRALEGGGGSPEVPRSGCDWGASPCSREPGGCSDIGVVQGLEASIAEETRVIHVRHALTHAAAPH